MLPEYGYDFLIKTFKDDLVNMWTLIIICNDKLVRSAICKIILQTINVTIAVNNLSLEAS